LLCGIQQPSPSASSQNGIPLRDAETTQNHGIVIGALCDLLIRQIINAHQILEPLRPVQLAGSPHTLHVLHKEPATTQIAVCCRCQ
jgi:hypothetical protein